MLYLCALKTWQKGQFSVAHSTKNEEMRKGIKNNKNSSGDKIANVIFLRLYRTRTSKYQKENLHRLTN